MITEQQYGKNAGFAELHSLLLVEDITVEEYGYDKMYVAIQNALDTHNERYHTYNEQLCVYTADQMRRYGGNARMKMLRGDEFGQPEAHVCGSTGTNMGFQLGRHRISIGFTKSYVTEQTPSDLSKFMFEIFKADTKHLMKRYARSVFNPQSNLDYEDALYNSLILPIRPFLNGDGLPIPIAMDGTDFDCKKHSHYSASMDLTEDVVAAAYENVKEHGLVGTPQIYFNFFRKDFAKSLKSFKAYDFKKRPKHRLNDDYAIGMCEYGEVWIKDWVPDDRFVVCDTGNEEHRPLILRTRPGGVYSDLRLRGESAEYPLFSQTMVRDDGVSVWNRHMMAVHQFGSEEYTWS